ncbi:MAG: hypothetical protein AAFX99_22690 [Myxococcota bacterium]
MPHPMYDTRRTSILKYPYPIHGLGLALLAMGCGSATPSTESDTQKPSSTSAQSDTDPPSPTSDTSSTFEDASETTSNSDTSTGNPSPRADVTAVRVSGGSSGAFTLAVTIRSDETGCEQYADWWEVVDADSGQLLYRRILAHSHVTEQPFERSGGPVPIEPTDTVVVRAHMNTTGYTGQVMRGSAGGTFSVESVAEGFASELSSAEPQPSGCAF